MIVDFFQEHFISGPVKQIFTRMNFITDIHPAFIKIIQDGCPAFSEFLKSFFHESGRTLRPWMKRMP